MELMYKKSVALYFNKNILYCTTYLELKVFKDISYWTVNVTVVIHV